MPPCRVAYEEAKEYLERLKNPDLNGYDNIQTSHVLFVSLTESNGSNVHNDSEDEEPLAINFEGVVVPLNDIVQAIIMKRPLTW